MAHNVKQTDLGGNVRAKAQAMREAQERADKRIRNIVIGVVTAIVVAVVGVVGWVVATTPVKNVTNTVSAEEVTALLGDYADGKPIVLSHEGFGVVDEALPTLTEYFDYSCPGCAVVHGLIGQNVLTAMHEGKFNVAFQPVNTHAAPWHFIATGASVIVANKAPEKWESFHDAVLNYTNAELQAGRGAAFDNAASSYDAVKTIAAQVGVPQDIIDSIPTNAGEDYLAKSSLAWQQSQVEGREKHTTPEFVANGKKKIELDFADPAVAMSEILAALK